MRLDETFGAKQDFSKFPQDLQEGLEGLAADKELSYVSPHGSRFIDWVSKNHYVAVGSCDGN